MLCPLGVWSDCNKCPSSGDQMSGAWAFFRLRLVKCVLPVVDFVPRSPNSGHRHTHRVRIIVGALSTRFATNHLPGQRTTTTNIQRGNNVPTEMHSAAEKIALNSLLTIAYRGRREANSPLARSLDICIILSCSMCPPDVSVSVCVAHGDPKEC